MYPYHYTVSLRLWHPHRNLAGAEKVFRLSTARTWVKGAPRATPNGAPLQGAYPNSYWYAQLTNGRKVSSKREEIESFLAKILRRYSGRRQYLRRLLASGGRAELFVGLYGKRNFAAELPPSLLSNAGKLGLALTFDIYP
jgi:hypothetical protein